MRTHIHTQAHIRRKLFERFDGASLFQLDWLIVICWNHSKNKSATGA